MLQIGPIHVSFFVFFFLAQIEYSIANSIAERTQNTTNPAEATRPEWKSRNNVPMYPILPCND